MAGHPSLTLQTMANKFLRGADSSDEDSDDEDKIRVLSAKDKRCVLDA